MTETTLSIPEIHCGHCKQSIERAVNAVPGVLRAEVDVPSATVTLTFAPPATFEQIVAAVESEGYEVPAQA